MSNTKQQTETGGGNAPRGIYIDDIEVANYCDKLEASRDQWQRMYDDELTWFNDMKAQRDGLLAACKEAADWLIRSARIDDQEQAQDLRAAIATAEGSN